MEKIGLREIGRIGGILQPGVFVLKFGFVYSVFRAVLLNILPEVGRMIQFL
jgi:hypothetical protein